MNTCMAQATKYVGKGKDRKQYSGPCVLEIGHDLDHLTAQEAYEQQHNAAYNSAIEQVLALDHLDPQSELFKAIEALRK